MRDVAMGISCRLRVMLLMVMWMRRTRGRRSVDCHVMMWMYHRWVEMIRDDPMLEHTYLTFPDRMRVMVGRDVTYHSRMRSSSCRTSMPCQRMS